VGASAPGTADAAALERELAPQIREIAASMGGMPQPDRAAILTFAFSADRRLAFGFGDMAAPAEVLIPIEELVRDLLEFLNTADP
jgi:hypothetical protein